MKPSGVGEAIKLAYRLDIAEDEWQRVLMNSMGPLIGGDLQSSFSAHVVNTSGQKLELEKFIQRSESGQRDWALWSRAITRLAPKAAYDGFSKSVCVSTRDIYGASLVSRVARAYGLKGLDVLGVLAHNRVGAALLFAVPQTTTSKFTPGQARRLTELASTIGSGYRLRQLVATTTEEHAIEARFDREGHCLDASGITKESTLLERLRARVRHREAGRTQQLEDLPAECREQLDFSWSSLVEGRWSLVDRFDSDGKHFVVAYRNPAGVLDPRKLTPREREVAVLACCGLSNGEIAAETGTTASTVGVQIGRVVSKLGLSSRLQLPAFYRATDATSQPFALDTDLAAVSVEETRPQSCERGFSGLTPSEREVANLTLRGLSSKAAAAVRSVSPRTISQQLASIYRKLNISSRGELAAYANDAQRREPQEQPTRELN